MHDAIGQTLEYYKDSGRHLPSDTALHRSQGVCVWSPELVLMARPVDSTDEPERVVDPAVRYDVDKCDAWFVHLIVGDLRRVRDIEGVIRLFPFVVFQRHSKGDASLRRMGHQYYSLLFR